MRASAAKHRDPLIPTLKFIKDSQRFKELTERERERLEELADGKPRAIQRDAKGLREMQSIHRNSSIFVSYYKVEAGSSLKLSKPCSTLSHNHVREQVPAAHATVSGCTCRAPCDRVRSLKIAQKLYEFFSVVYCSSLKLARVPFTISHNNVREKLEVAWCLCPCLRVHISCTLRRSKVSQSCLKVV